MGSQVNEPRALGPADDSVAALIVTYFPDSGLGGRIDVLLEQVSRVVIVDNGSDESTLSSLRTYTSKRVTLVSNGENLGIATALNTGMRLLAAEGYEWVLTLDQDSAVGIGFVPALLATLHSDPAPENLALVGANRHDRGIGNPHRWLRPKMGIPFFERVRCEKLGVAGTTLVITSGTLTNVAAFKTVGPFRDDLFIDLVDIEYCLRARRAGYRIVVSCAAELSHQVGAKSQASFLWLTLAPTHHLPIRRYYLFRNSVPLLRTYGRAYPHWLIYHLIALVEVIAGVVLVERRKLAKLRACLIGMWDGLRGRTGPARVPF